MRVFGIGFMLILLIFMITFAFGIALLGFAGGEGGAVIMIGPIPIVFASSMGSAVLLMLLSLVLMGTYLMSAFYLGRREAWRWEQHEQPQPPHFPPHMNNDEEGYGEEHAQTSQDIKGGAVIMLGPIPIVIGSDARWASILIVLVILLMLMYIFIRISWVM